MEGNSQENKSENVSLHALEKIISPLRLYTYLNAAGHDADRALRLYLWNAQVGESFHIPIQAAEVGLRNRVNNALSATFGAEWWRNAAYLQGVEPRQGEDIALALRRLTMKGKNHSTGQVVASLSFGFWVAMLHKRYNPAVWSHQLRSSFPHLPIGITRDALHKEVQEIAELRNRLWHHEPIFKRNLTEDHGRCMRVVQWLCPTKAAWIRPHCRFNRLIREKP